MQAIDRIMEDEGFRSHAYVDGDGLSIGYGRRISEDGGGISKREALFMLQNDILACEHDLGDLFTWPLWLSISRVRRDALVNMRYNLGPSRFRGFRNMIAAIRMKDWSQAAREALDSKWARQVGRRARRIAYELENDSQLYDGVF